MKMRLELEVVIINGYSYSCKTYSLTICNVCDLILFLPFLFPDPPLQTINLLIVNS